MNFGAFARTLAAFAISCLTLLIVVPAMAYPEGRITLVVPFAAGGTTDAVARVIADALGTKLGQTVLVENRPGAGTMVGANYVVKAKPDGYTLLMASADSLTTGLAMRRNPPFDPLKDFTTIALLTVSPMVVSVNPKVPAANLKELAAYATKTGQPSSLRHRWRRNDHASDGRNAGSGNWHLTASRPLSRRRSSGFRCRRRPD